MLQIRYGLFETNSSSTHSLYFATVEEFDLFRKGKTVLDEDGNFVPWEKAVESIIQTVIDDGYTYPIYDSEDNEISFDTFRAMSHEEQAYILRDWNYTLYENMGEYNYMYEDTYKTPSGDEIIAFGEYGWDS